MKAVAAQGAAEEPTPAANPEGGSNLPRITRKNRDEAIRVLRDLGYVVSGAQAWRLLRDWQRWRASDCREFIAAEFGEYVQRRGDLMQIRSKRHHEWRTRT